jgi:hypothetical protein
VGPGSVIHPILVVGDGVIVGFLDAGCLGLI